MPKRLRDKRSTFLPAQVETITSVSPALQRTWRFRGHAESGNGGSWNRYSLLDTAQFLVQGELFKRGFPPRVSRLCARLAAPHIVLWAQKVQTGGKGRQVARSSRKPKRFLIQFGNSKTSCALGNNLTSFYDRTRDPKLATAIVIDLARLGKRLAPSINQENA
jgi:hypothetical protein